MMDLTNSVVSPRGLPGGAPLSEANKQFITFTLGHEEYGVDIMAVREIKGWSETTPIPHAPRFVQGVINLRGVIVPIMDLRARFGMELTKPTQMHVVIIINIGARTTGLLVDGVSDIISVSPDAIRPVPEMGLGAQESLLSGLVALDVRMVSLVSLEGLIGTRDLCLAASAGAPTQPSA